MVEIGQRARTARGDGQVAHRLASGPAPHRRQAHNKGEHGSISIVFALMVCIIFGFVGLAIDLSLVYNRKEELQTLADSAALAAADQLVGTTTGVQNALSAAATEAAGFKYHYHRRGVVWSNDAIKFSRSVDPQDAVWIDAGAALASPDGLLFAKVDTAGLDPAYNNVRTIFMSILPDANASATVAGVAIAGRSSINVTPLAICALSNTAANARTNVGPPANVELEEYGFRRGVSYDLMNLSPNSTTTPDNFVVNPIDRLGVAGSAANTSAATVSPFVCAGTMPMPRVKGTPASVISVGRPFPLNELFIQLNSRFDVYAGGPCIPEKAPPDTNVRAFDRAAAAVPWMAAVPQSQSANTSTIGGKLWTIASPPDSIVPPKPATTLGTAYGPLWSFARAVPFSAYTAGVTEPANGYATFAATSAVWGTLYSPGKPAPNTAPNAYPANTPYGALSGVNFTAPSVAHRPGVSRRRVLNVPLLSCPVAPGPNSTATVLAIGRFFMTVPATTTTINAEFAGAVQDQTLGGPVELFR